MFATLDAAAILLQPGAGNFDNFDNFDNRHNILIYKEPVANLLLSGASLFLSL